MAAARERLLGIVLLLVGCSSKLPNPTLSPTPIVTGTQSLVSADPMVEFTFDLVYPKASDQPRPAVLVKTLAYTAPEITAVAEFQSESGHAQMWPEEVEASAVKDEFIERFCDGLSAQQLATLRRPYSVLFFHFRVPIKESTSALRQAEKFVYALCNERGILGDDEGAHYCPKAIWKKSRIDSWQGQVPDVLPRMRLYGDSFIDPEAFHKASQKARQELFLRWKPAYLKGLEKDESLFVKAPFVQGKDTEFMWLEVTSWKGKSLKGLLLEDAGLIPQLKAGSQVQVNEDKLLDFLLRSPRRGSGGTTDELVQAHPL